LRGKDGGDPHRGRNYVDLREKEWVKGELDELENDRPRGRTILNPHQGGEGGEFEKETGCEISQLEDFKTLLPNPEELEGKGTAKDGRRGKKLRRLPGKVEKTSPAAIALLIAF